MDYQTQERAALAMAAWAETTKAPALALVQAADTERFRVLEADVDGTLVLRRAERVIDTAWTVHGAGIAELVYKNAYSLACCTATWQVHERSMHVPHGADDLTQALGAAVEEANDSPDWETDNFTGRTFIDVLAEGEGVNPWRNDARDRIPESMTVEGPRPIVLIRMAAGRIDDVKVMGGGAHVVAVNKDGEALDRGPHIKVEGDQGEMLLTHWTGPDDLASLPEPLLQELGLALA